MKIISKTLIEIDCQSGIKFILTKFMNEVVIKVYFRSVAVNLNDYNLTVEDALHLASGLESLVNG